jgi:hypothetical protein
VDHANHFYGHAHVLARYCGLDPQAPPRMRGYLQHGWNIGDGLAPGMGYADGSPIFVWSERTRRRAWSVGRRNVVVTGAPWIYLLAMEPHLAVVPPHERIGTIFYPFHGWERQEVRGDHRRLVSLIREVEPGPVTVCLYWHEFRNRRVRRLYERGGFRIVCHGYRGQWWQRTDAGFLYRQLAELRRHRRVASNRVCTAILYGITAGCEPAVYGDPMTLVGEDHSFGGVDRIRREWPQLHGVAPDPDGAREVAEAELGMPFRASPAELRELLGWQRVEDRSGVRPAVDAGPAAAPPHPGEVGR